MVVLTHYTHHWCTNSNKICCLPCFRQLHSLLRPCIFCDVMFAMCRARYHHIATGIVTFFLLNTWDMCDLRRMWANVMAPSPSLDGNVPQIFNYNSLTITVTISQLQPHSHSNYFFSFTEKVPMPSHSYRTPHVLFIAHVCWILWIHFYGGKNNCRLLLHRWRSVSVGQIGNCVTECAHTDQTQYVAEWLSHKELFIIIKIERRKCKMTCK